MKRSNLLKLVSELEQVERYIQDGARFMVAHGEPADSLIAADLLDEVEEIMAAYIARGADIRAEIASACLS